MSHAPLVRDRSVKRFAPLALLAVVATSCDVPAFEGPQIQSPPPAFYKQPDAYQQRRLFPQLELIHHDAWVETSWGHFSAIYIDGHPGALTRDDVVEAQAAAKAAVTDPVTFGAIEELTIDGRQAWGWAERLQTPRLGIDWIGYKAVVPYDTITYALEFHGGEPGLKGRPDTAKVVLSSFAIGKTTYDLPLIAVLAGMGLLVLNFMRSRARARQLRHQSITLKQIPKKEKKEGEQGDPGATGGAAAAGAQRPATTPGSIADAVRAAAEKQPGSAAPRPSAPAPSAKPTGAAPPPKPQGQPPTRPQAPPGPKPPSPSGDGG